MADDMAPVDQRALLFAQRVSTAAWDAHGGPQTR
eukprot:CAMPEP_0196667128 /NCGR_PEP_ID=MMETSP1086-20130531/64907_1 /TAXON_ID=77921 /ORGANISM="Cyanoptyche  gloeocystis , Strain SAG4.97" /LENGTH=33 /DNA_ID= /DNA_START= /DNA_END= /DNA_ORIENTATION=